jgi:hypothetical protein
MVLKNRHSFTRAVDPQRLIANDLALVSRPSEPLDLIHRIDQAEAAFRSLGHPLFDTSTGPLAG